ncbi:MAG: sulfur carrier protein ThiS [Parvibaculaceae bacterium]
MKIVLNGQPREVSGTNVTALLEELGYGSARVAAAVNGAFVPASLRPTTMLLEGDRLEVVAPMQGG